MKTKLITRAVIAAIISPLVLAMLIVIAPVYFIALLVHCLDDNFENALGTFVNDCIAYKDEWVYVVKTYIKVFTFKN